MTDHLSPEILNALSDGELNVQELASLQEHLATCAACTREALSITLLKSGVTRAAHRYSPPPELLDRLSRQVAQASAQEQFQERIREPTQQHGREQPPAAAPETAPARPALRNSLSLFGWSVAAAALLLAVSSLFTLQWRSARNANVAVANNLVTEVFDQHVATLAGTAPPEVLSSDNHTVKPWFQGRLPFAFNLPEKLPSGMTLDGANLAYLHGQPAAQLLFSIGRHRVSVFVTEKAGVALPATLSTDHAGFHVMQFSTADLEGIAVSDVNPGRLAELVHALESVQNKG